MDHAEIRLRLLHSLYQKHYGGKLNEYLGTPYPAIIKISASGIDVIDQIISQSLDQIKNQFQSPEIDQIVNEPSCV